MLTSLQKIQCYKEPLSVINIKLVAKKVNHCALDMKALLQQKNLWTRSKSCELAPNFYLLGKISSARLFISTLELLTFTHKLWIPTFFLKIFRIKCLTVDILLHHTKCLEKQINSNICTEIWVFLETLKIVQIYWPKLRYSSFDYFLLDREHVLRKRS